MKIIKNKLSNIGRAPMDIDNLNSLPFIPEQPLPPKNFAMMLVGSPGSGKTNLMLQLLMSHPTKKNKDKPRYYYGLFDSIVLISPSMATLPSSFLKKLDDDRTHMKFSDELITDIINNMYEGANVNNLLVLDDCIRDLSRSKNLSKVFLNRRHNASLSIIVTNQKYSLLPLEFRNSLSDIIIFKCSNKNEINRIKDEIMFDLDSSMQDLLLEQAWSEPYSFLYVKPNKPLQDKYYIKFDKVEF
jgi:GTPase SAR1 family protein